MPADKPRILIVEDSPAMRQLLALAISRLPNAVVDEAPDGVAALRALKQAQDLPYDLVFLDINMPVMDGIKLLGRLKDDAAANRTVVAVVTTSEGGETEAQARQLGARYFVRKPINRKVVEGILAEVFGREPGLP
jgi:two-component system chemotaxis response regulator CheY